METWLHSPLILPSDAGVTPREKVSSTHWIGCWVDELEINSKDAVLATQSLYCTDMYVGRLRKTMKISIKTNKSYKENYHMHFRQLLPT
jgi:hypothetical protein